MIVSRAEPHLTEGNGVDPKDWVSVNALPFYSVLGGVLGLFALFCIWAINRGANRPLFPCIPCLSRSKSVDAPNSTSAPGPDSSVWAATPGDHHGNWGHKVYLTDLKRQSAAGLAGIGPGAGGGGYDRQSMTSYDQRVVDWQSGAGYSSAPQGSTLSPIPETSPHGRQGRKSARLSTNARSPLSSSGHGNGQPRTSSPASTFHSHTHLLPTVFEPHPQQHQFTPFQSPASTLVPKRISSLPVSPPVLNQTAANPIPMTDRESFGHTPSMYASSIWSDGVGLNEGVAVPPRARVAYSPFTPKDSVPASGSQRDSLRSIRGFAV